MKLITEMLASFPNSNLDIDRATEATNSIWERTQAWNPVYSNIKCIFSLKNQSWDENEWWGKLNVSAKFTARFDISDIWDDINNINVNDRAKIDWKIYKIEFIHHLAEDHAILFINEFD